MSKHTVIHIIDSHTAGEPTRVIIDGGPDLGSGSLAELRSRFQLEFDQIRKAVTLEPRGSEALVGALLVPPTQPNCDVGVIFFNNVGYLNMCGHGTVGLVVTLAHLGRIQPGPCRIETPVGIVTADLRPDGSVAVANVPSYRYRKNVAVEVDELGTVHGDIAWGGNWFFLVSDHGQELQFENIETLTDVAWRIRQALERDGITGENDGLIDHIELFGPAISEEANSRNFILCPGKAYDRSPCGTGTSAKLACLFADGKLQPGQRWRQESIIGSWFDGTVEPLVDSRHADAVIPTIEGTAFVTAESKLILGNSDPFRFGIE